MGCGSGRRPRPEGTFARQPSHVHEWLDAHQCSRPHSAENELLTTEGATMMRTMRCAAFALALATAGAVVAQPYGPGYGAGRGPGMMGDPYGHGMMGGGYGPGPMGGRQGGMMDGFGPGAGMMGLGALDLSDEQRDKVFAIHEEARGKNFGTMARMRAEQYSLAKMYRAEKADANAITDQQKKVDELRRDMIRSHVQTRNQIEALLTPEQKKQLRQYEAWWPQGDLD
jgi:Spy/CpxP family protein refolding chaperone